nr:DUF1127 domain-containing protein [uncultured Devosia sp.]
MLNAIQNRLSAWWQRDIAIRKLNAMDDHLLADLGTSRADIARFIRSTEEAGPPTAKSYRHKDTVRFRLDCVDA